MRPSTVVGITSSLLGCVIFVGLALDVWIILVGSLFLDYNQGILLFIALGDLFALISIPLLLNESGFFRANFHLLISPLVAGVLAAVVSGWVYGFQLVTPGGGGLYFGYPFTWRLTDQAWLGHQVANSYDWEAFTVDSLLYSGIAYAFEMTSGIVFTMLRLRQIPQSMLEQ